MQNDSTVGVEQEEYTPSGEAGRQYKRFYRIQGEHVGRLRSREQEARGRMGAEGWKDDVMERQKTRYISRK